MSKLFDRLISDISLDERVSDGIFDVSNNDHLAIMREYLVNKGIPEEMARDFSNAVMEAGKYPERQAYNKNGILVTFPSPQHKQNAIRRGTHFEKDPTKGRTNLFDPETGEKKRGPGRPPKDDKEKETGKFTSVSQGGGQALAQDGDAGASSLPLSGTDTSQSPETDDTETTTSAPNPDGEDQTTEPVDQLPPNVLPPKPPEEKEQDKLAISKMMGSKNTALGAPLDGNNLPMSQQTEPPLDTAKKHLKEALDAIDSIK